MNTDIILDMKYDIRHMTPVDVLERVDIPHVKTDGKSTNELCEQMRNNRSKKPKINITDQMKVVSKVDSNGDTWKKEKAYRKLQAARATIRHPTLRP